MSFRASWFSIAVYNLIINQRLFIEESMNLYKYSSSAVGSVGAEGSSDLLGTGTKPEELSLMMEYFGVS